MCKAKVSVPSGPCLGGPRTFGSSSLFRPLASLEPRFQGRQEVTKQATPRPHITPGLSCPWFLF